VPVGQVVTQIREELLRSSPDVVTLAGSGEPTLHSGIGRVINAVKAVTDIEVALLTNGSLFWRDEIREGVLGSDLILPTLCSGFEDTFRYIHRPHPALKLHRVIEGLIRLRSEYRGHILLEIVFIKGINDTDSEIEVLGKVIEQIHPEKIQLNTVVRPPADARAISLDRERLEEIRTFLGENAEVIAGRAARASSRQRESLTNRFLGMVRRRPLSAKDAADILGLRTDEFELLAKALVLKGHIRRQEHLGEIYYVSEQKEVQ
jgi:wyosine [tRNA(Phe)-imidazoG37] synthetase (radical SAM superfamily)